MDYAGNDKDSTGAFEMWKKVELVEEKGENKMGEKSRDFE